MNSVALAQKKGSIELFRYLFTISVCIMHFGYYNGAYIAVDFFFMLSGFLLFRNIDSRQTDSPYKLLLHKISRLYPEYILSFILMLIYNIKNTTFQNIALDAFITDSFFECFFLQIIHPFSSLVNGISWYVSAMVICLPILIFGLTYLRKFYLWVIAPYSALFIYAFLATNWRHVDFGVVWLGKMNGGLLRGFAALNLGILAYCIYKKFSSFSFSRWQHHMLSFVELLLFTAVFLYSLFFRQTIVDFIEIVLLFSVIILAFLEKGFLSVIASNPAVLWLGSISYAIYLNQTLVNVYVAGLGINSKVTEILVLILAQTIFGAGMHLIATLPRRVLNKKT